MKNINDKLSVEENAERIKKRKESKKFIKVYMFTLFGMVIVLISLSYFAQEKHNTQIEQLTIEADSNRQEAISQANSAEQLQQYLDQQETIIDSHIEDIEQYESQLNDYREKLDEVSSNLAFYQGYLSLTRLFEEEKYAECVVLLTELSLNDAYITSQENPDMTSDQSVITAEIVLDFENIVAQMLENEEIFELLTAEEIEILENL